MADPGDRPGGPAPPPPQVLVDCASIILSIIQQNEHYFKLLFQFSAAGIIGAFMPRKQKNHHSSRIIQFVFYFCIVFGKH